MSLTLTHVCLKHFRKWEKLALSFRNNLVLLHGPNCVGKTSILEAIHLVLGGSSVRSKNLHSTVQYGSDWASILAQMGDQSILEWQYHTGKTQLRFNHVQCSRKKVIESYPSILVQEIDQETLLYSDRKRWSFFAASWSTYDPQGRRHHQIYEVLSRYRRQYLQIGKQDKLDLIESQMQKLATKISKSKSAYLDQITDQVKKQAPFLHKICCTLRNGWPTTTSLASHLKASRSIDRDRYSDLYGCHKDYVSMTSNGYPIRAVLAGSEKKVLLYLLKMVQGTLLSCRPIYLLDDPHAEVDKNVIQYILSTAQRLGTQTILTDLPHNNLEDLLSTSNKLYQKIVLTD